MKDNLNHKSRRSTLIRHFAAVLQRLALGDYHINIMLDDGVAIVTILGFTEEDLQALSPLLADDPFWCDALVDAVVAGKLKAFREMVDSIDPTIWAQAVRPLEHTPHAGWRYVNEDSDYCSLSVASTSGWQFCFGIAVIAAALSHEMQLAATVDTE